MIYAVPLGDVLGASGDWGTILPLLRQYATNIPIYYLLGWIKRESGGDITDTTSAGEKGYFQISPGEARTYGYDLARLGTDPAYSIESGIDLVGNYGEVASGLGYSYGTDDFWSIVKLVHTVGKGGTQQLINAAGGGTPSWSAIEAAVDPSMQVGGRTAASAFGIVDDVFNQGATLADQLGVDMSEGQSSISPQESNALLYGGIALGVVALGALTWWVILPRVAPKFRRRYALSGAGSRPRQLRRRSRASLSA